VSISLDLGRARHQKTCALFELPAVFLRLAYYSLASSMPCSPARESEKHRRRGEIFTLIAHSFHSQQDAPRAKVHWLSGIVGES
jgi:hypothetical protein